jgi:hypothetical protein
MYDEDSAVFPYIKITGKTVQQWLPMSNSAAERVANYLNLRSLSSYYWAPRFAAKRESDPNLQRLRRIREAVETLRNDLPPLIEQERRYIDEIKVEEVKSVYIDHSLRKTEQLLAIATEMASNFGMLELLAPPRHHGRGRPSDWPVNYILKDLAKIFDDIYRIENPGKEPPTGKLDRAVADALGWLMGKRQSEQAISKKLRRSGQ